MIEEQPEDVERETTAGREDGELTPGKDVESKHLLEHKWTLWFDAGSSSRTNPGTWGSTLRSVYSFNSVEDFWCLYNNIKQPSGLSTGADFHLFKYGVEPKWEDPRNAHGGKWTIPIPKGNKQMLDQYWLNVLMASIGEHFTEGEDICGVVVNIRAKQDRVSVWTKTASDEAIQVSIGKQLKSVLDLEPTTRMGFTTHEDQMHDRNCKDKYTA